MIEPLNPFDDLSHMFHKVNDLIEAFNRIDDRLNKIENDVDFLIEDYRNRPERT